MRPEWLERWRLRIARNKPLEAAYRVFVLVVGWPSSLAGVAMLVFPGPGWAAIILGLLVLATEYRWAERLLEPVQRFVRWLARRAKDPKARAENIVFVADAGGGGRRWRCGRTSRATARRSSRCRSSTDRPQGRELRWAILVSNQ